MITDRATLPDPPEGLTMIDDVALEAFMGRVVADLGGILGPAGLDASLYAEDVEFSDPVTRIHGRTGYLLGIQALRVALDPAFDIHSARPAGPDAFRVRWTVRYHLPLPVPFGLRDRPFADLSGESTYTCDVGRGVVTRIVDTWDGLSPEGQRTFSAEALRDVAGAVLQAAVQPAAPGEQPAYVTLRRTGRYEVRRYESFPAAERPAGGAGAGAGAGGAVPVFRSGRATPGEGDGEGTVSFMLPRGGPGGAGDAPAATEKALGVVAALRFGGRATEREARLAAEELRELLDREGLRAAPGYELALYNPPGGPLPPFLGRSEVLLRLLNWDDAAGGPTKAFAPVQ